MARKKTKRISNKSKKRMGTKKKSSKGSSKRRKVSKKSMGKIKVVSDLLSSSYGIGALQKKKASRQDEMDSFLKGIDSKSSGPYQLDAVYKEDEKKYKGQRVHKKDQYKDLTPKKPKGKAPSKKSPKSPKKRSKKKSGYQEFISKKLKEYKSLDIPQPEKMKKAAEEWKKFKSV